MITSQACDAPQLPCCIESALIINDVARGAVQLLRCLCEALLPSHPASPFRTKAKIRHAIILRHTRVNEYIDNVQVPGT